VRRHAYRLGARPAAARFALPTSPDLGLATLLSRWRNLGAGSALPVCGDRPWRLRSPPARLLRSSRATKYIRAVVDFPPTARIDTRLTIVDWPLSVDDELQATVSAVTTFELANDVPAVVEDGLTRHLA
jgi:hypothetical protein